MFRCAESLHVGLKLNPNQNCGKKGPCRWFRFFDTRPNPNDSWESRSCLSFFVKQETCVGIVIDLKGLKFHTQEEGFPFVLVACLGQMRVWWWFLFEFLGKDILNLLGVFRNPHWKSYFSRFIKKPFSFVLAG